MKLIPLLLLLCCVGCDIPISRSATMSKDGDVATIYVDGEMVQYRRERKCDDYLEIIYSSLDGDRVVDSTKNYIPLTDTTWLSLVWLHDSTTGRAFMVRKSPCSN